MKFVVTGMLGVIAFSADFCSSKQTSHESEEKRDQSRCWVGLPCAGEYRGGWISSQSP